VARHFTGECRVGQLFQRDDSIQPRIARAIHLSHAAGAEPIQNEVRA
jgi:hypothetical protein